MRTPLVLVVVFVATAVQAFSPLLPSSSSFSSSFSQQPHDQEAQHTSSRRINRQQHTVSQVSRSMLTIGHDAAVQTALPMLFGSWVLKEKRVARPLWGRKQVKHAGVLGTEDGGGGGGSFEVLLLPKGRLEQPLDSALRGLDWRLNFQDIYATGKLEFKIVHPPPAKKLVANDQLPSIHYYSGVFCDGLDRVEGTIERYSDIEDEKLGPIRKKVCIGQFCLKKKKEE